MDAPYNAPSVTLIEPLQLSDVSADVVLLSHILILGNRICRGQTAEIDMKVVLDARDLLCPLGLIGY